MWHVSMQLGFGDPSAVGPANDSIAQEIPQVLYCRMYCKGCLGMMMQERAKGSCDARIIDVFVIPFKCDST